MVCKLQNDNSKRDFLFQELMSVLPVYSPEKLTSNALLLNKYLTDNKIEHYLLFSTVSDIGVSFTKFTENIVIVHITDGDISLLNEILSFTKCKKVVFQSNQLKGFCIEAIGEDIDFLYDFFRNKTLGIKNIVN